MSDTVQNLRLVPSEDFEKLQRERDEARSLAEERKTYWDSEYRAYEDMRSLWMTATKERDQWRECAESLAAFVVPVAADMADHAACAAALAEFERLKEDSK